MTVSFKKYHRFTLSLETFSASEIHYPAQNSCLSCVYRLLIHVSSSVKSYTYASASTEFLKISAGNLLEDPTNSNHSNFKSRRIKFRSSSSLSPLPPAPYPSQCIWPGSWKLWKYFVRNVLICLAFEMCNMVQCTR